MLFGCNSLLEKERRIRCFYYHKNNRINSIEQSKVECIEASIVFMYSSQIWIVDFGKRSFLRAYYIVVSVPRVNIPMRMTDFHWTNRRSTHELALWFTGESNVMRSLNKIETTSEKHKRSLMYAILRLHILCRWFHAWSHGFNTDRVNKSIFTHNVCVCLFITHAFFLLVR